MHCWHGLNKDAASGVDGLTAETYGANLEGDIAELAERVKAGRYRAKLVRRVYIPKENGTERPLGIPALEDKLVQLACAKLLGVIYEEDFLDCSHGYRPGQSAKDTVRDLSRTLTTGTFGYVVEADIRGFFEHMDHDWLRRMLSLRIDDRAFLDLIGKWLKAGILDTDGAVLQPDTGTPQGGIVYRYWLTSTCTTPWTSGLSMSSMPRCRGEVLLCRYADDFVCAFRYGDDAQRFFTVLPKRLEKFGLDVAPEKTQVLRFSRFHPSMRRRVTFLGFELFWFPDRNGTPQVMRRTARKKLHGAIARVTDWIKSHRHLPGREFIKGLNRRLLGHYHYYGLRGNSRGLWCFFQMAVECAFKWLNRRGGKRKSFTWPVFNRTLQKLGIARPRITERSDAQPVFA